MTMHTYLNTSDPRKLNKVLTQLNTLNIRLKDDTDIMRPIIELAGALPPVANYCYIVELGRYYYINQQTIKPGRLLDITLDIDVLMSWATQISGSTVIASRSTNKCNKLITDSIPMIAKPNNIYKAFTPHQGLYAFDSGTLTSDTPCVLLTVTKGGTTS